MARRSSSSSSSSVAYVSVSRDREKYTAASSSRHRVAVYIISEEQLTFRSAAANIWRVRSTTSLAQRLSAPFVGVFSAPTPPRNNRQFSHFVRPPPHLPKYTRITYIYLYTNKKTHRAAVVVVSCLSSAGRALGDGDSSPVG